MDKLVASDTDNCLVDLLFCGRPENSFVDIELQVFFETCRLGTTRVNKSKKK